MAKKIFLYLFLVFSIFLFVQIVEPLSVTCRMGGPYIKNSTYNITINIVGSITDGGGTTANVSANLTKAGVVLAAKNTTSNSGGSYVLSINRSLDIGTYAVNISAEKDGTYAYCNNTTEVSLTQAPACLTRTVQAAGIAVYPGTGLTVATGTARLTIQGESLANQSSFTDGQFSTLLSGCLATGKRYILQIYIEDDAGKKSWSHMFVSW